MTSNPSSFDRIVIVPCGEKKRDCRCPAGEMYTGSYHRVCLEYARSLVPNNQILILSAKYGLLTLETEIIPYELKVGEKGSVDDQTIKAQAYMLKVQNKTVIALGGKHYVYLIRQTWPNAQTPLRGKGGMGKQMQWMKQEIKKNA